MAAARLKPGDLLKVSVTVPIEAEEAVAALFERCLRCPPALYTDEDTLRTEINVFLNAARQLSPRQHAALERGLARLRTAGLPLARARLRQTIIPRRRWEEAWKRHFHPIEVGRRLLVKPTWSRRAPRPGQVAVRLDPGLSFGTGQHPTTAFCLEQIVRLAPRSGKHAPAPSRSLLDIGAGSGILAIAAARLGYAPVEAFDFDPDAVAAARANAELNGVANQIHLTRRDLRRLPLRAARRFDVVCANLLADLLVAQRERILARVAPGGTLVLAGILASEFASVVAAYRSAGWRTVTVRTAGEWRSAALRRAA